MKKFFITIIVILAIILLAGIALLVDTKRKIDSGEMIKWQGQWYTKDQIKKKYGEQYYNTPAKNTPEEVYTAFREALLVGDIEKALLQMRPERREEYRKAFQDKEKFSRWLKSMPEKIVVERVEGNFGYYLIDYGTKNKNTVDFLKDINGYWQIDII